jgi:hypothetical protein
MKDENGAVYWDFADQRLYKETPVTQKKGQLIESTWSTPCVLPADWQALVESLKKTKNASQKELHNTIATVSLINGRRQKYWFLFYPINVCIFLDSPKGAPAGVCG